MDEIMCAHEQRKAKVLNYIDQTISILSSDNDSDTIQALENMRSNVENDLFKIVVIGEFSSGKSTFLNALMHKYVLPSLSVETTATVNYLRHSSKAPDGVAGKVYYNDENREPEILHDLSIHSVEKVVSVKGDTASEKVATSINHVDLFFDNEFLEEGVMLVDSPGLNGLAPYHRQITEKEIKSSHACIFLFTAEKPGSQSEFQFLSELKEQQQNIFLVLNKIDRINPMEQTVESVIGKLKASYQEQFPSETELPEIWPIAAYDALEARDRINFTMHGNYPDQQPLTDELRAQLEERSRLADFETRLKKYLTLGERTQEQLKTPVDHCLTILSAQEKQLQKKISLLNESVSVDELERQKHSLEEEITRLQQNRKNISSDTRQQVKGELDKAVEQVQASCVRLRNRIDADVQSIETPDELVSYGQSVDMQLKNQYICIIDDAETSLREGFLDIVDDEYNAYFDVLQEQMSTSSNTFNFSIDPLSLKQKFSSVNLELFNQQCKEREEVIRRLEQEADQLEDNSYEARRAERNIAEAKKEVKDIQDRRDRFESEFILPNVVYHDKEKEDSHWRRGLLGKIATPFIGKVYETKHISEKDTSERDEAKKAHEIERQKFDEEERRAQARLSALPLPQKDVELINKQAQRARDKVAEEQKKYAEEMEAYSNKLNENAEKECGRLRKRILTYVEGSNDMYIRYTRDTLDKLERTYLKDIRELINDAENQQLSTARSKLDKLTEEIQTSAEDRAKHLNEASAISEKIQELITDGAQLYAELETELSDHIEKETI